MANVTSNSLFLVSALVFVVGLLFLVYPYLTLAAITLCAIGYASYTHSSVLFHYYSNLSATLCSPVTVIDRPVPFASNLLSGADLPSPIPHIPSGIETFKNRKSPADEIISSTPRCSPTSGHGSSSPIPMQMQMRASAEVATNDSRQLNFGRISTPKSSHVQAQDMYQNHVEANSNQKLRSRSNSNKVIQTMAGPLLASARYNPPFDAGIFVNVNSPGFTDRLVRCANDNINWGQGGLATRQDKYGSVGLFPVVHLNAPTTPSLSPKNSQKAPNSSVRVRIAAPAYSEQRQYSSRGNNIQMRSYAPTRESLRRNDVVKSVLESLQEASRKRIYSQCQEVLEEDSGKKRQRKGDSALPNPNCDMYQYRHIRAPIMPLKLPANAPNEVHSQSKRVHDDPSLRANEPKRQRQQGRPQSTNNEISSSLSSSKTLLQRLSGSKRKADYECSEGGSEKHFKDASNAVSTPSTSRWLHSRSCDEGESAARTQEVVRSQKKSTPDSTPAAFKKIVQKKPMKTENTNHNSTHKSVSTAVTQTVTIESHEKVEADVNSKLFRKDVVSRSHPKVSQPEKRGSTWTQEPPDADERCLLEQSNSSDIDRPERFQSLMSRMCGQDALNVNPSESLQLQTALEPLKATIASTTSSDLGKTHLNMVTSPIISATSPVSSIAVSASVAPTPVLNPTPLAVSNPELTKSLSAASIIQTSVAPPSIQSASLSAFFPTCTPSPQASNTHFISQPFGIPPSQEVKVSAPAEQDNTDEPLALTLPSVSLSSPPAKPMFNFSPPTSTSPPRPIVPQAHSLTTASASLTSSTNPTSFAPSIFKFSVSPLKPYLDSAEQQPSASTKLSSATSKPPSVSVQGGGFSFLSAQPPSTVDVFSGSGKSLSTLTETVKFSLPSEKPQFSTGSGTLMTRSQANGPTSTASTLLTSGLPAASSNQTQTSTNAALSSSEGQKSSFGGFHFIGSSGSIFGQSSTNGLATLPPFSFAPSTTSASGTAPEKPCLDSKSVSGSGSITFGTVSTAVLPQPTNPVSFTFTSPNASGNTSGSDTLKSPFQLSAFGATGTNAEPSSSGFRNPPQGIFNGFTSNTNSSISVTPSFGSSPQQNQQQNQQQVTGMFSFGSSQSQQQSAVRFGAQQTSTSSIFGEGTSQPPNFGATTTTGFPSQSTVPSFSSSPFGSSTSLSTLPFGGSQPSNANPFGGQAASNNAPSFGLSSANTAAFCNSPVSTVTPSFGSTSPPPFGVNTEPSFGSNPSSAPVATVNSAFSFGGSDDKPATSAFNFGLNSPAAAPTFSFGATEQQQQSSGSAPFQFGQSANHAPGSTFQFGSPSAQPGSGSFSMGSGPSTPQRSRSSQIRRKRT